MTICKHVTVIHSQQAHVGLLQIVLYVLIVYRNIFQGKMKV